MPQKHIAEVRFSSYMGENPIVLARSMHSIFTNVDNRSSLAVDFPGTVRSYDSSYLTCLARVLRNQQKMHKSWRQRETLDPFTARVIRVGGKVVGISTLGWAKSGPTLDGVQVAEGASMGMWLECGSRGMGVGSLAVADRVDFVQRHASRYSGNLWAHVRAENAASAANLEANGFQVVSEGEHTIDGVTHAHGKVYVNKAE